VETVATSVWQHLVEQLRGRGIAFDAGLTDAEVEAAEARFGIRFPPDLRAFLQTALARGKLFPDWRAGDEADLREWLDLPRRGILFDVGNGFWMEDWGARPATWDEAQQLVSSLIAAAPKLVPVCQHRMMPDEPHAPGNPVFSVHQADIIWYGFDLEDYIQNEWNLPGRRSWQNPKPIRFWDIERFQSVRWNGGGGWRYDNSAGLLP
jgi:hypothetical protein